MTGEGGTRRPAEYLCLFDILGGEKGWSSHHLQSILPDPLYLPTKDRIDGFYTLPRSTSLETDPYSLRITHLALAVPKRTGVKGEEGRRTA